MRVRPNAGAGRSRRYIESSSTVNSGGVYVTAELKLELQQLVKGENVDHFGIAELNAAREAIVEQGGTCLEPFDYAVSMGYNLDDAIVDMLPDNNREKHPRQVLAQTGRTAGGTGLDWEKLPPYYARQRTMGKVGDSAR
jgi:hypothetical protein